MGKKLGHKKAVLLATTALVLAVVAGGTVYQTRQADASPPEAAAPALPVATIQVMKEEPVELWKDFSGRLRAVDFVELRPQVSGSIQEIRFQDGQIVNKGDILLVIDPAPYQAAVEQARAALQAAKNQASLAQKDLVRAEGLVKSEAISKRIYDERNNTALVTKSQVESAAAALRQAEIDLDHAYVKAPISGRISRAELTEGNLVQAGSGAPVLTTIASNEGIYADFEVDEKTYLENVYSLARDRESQSKIPVEMILQSGVGSTYEGTIESFDNRIDPATGTIRARAIFSNEDGVLMPGMFVNIRLGSASQEKKILVPDVAIGTDQNRKFVYVIGEGSKVAYREIKPGASIEGRRVVLEGLKAGDQVITEGIMKMRPDMEVTTQLAGTAPKSATKLVSAK